MAISNIAVSDADNSSNITIAASGNNRKVLAFTTEARNPTTVTSMTLNGVTGSSVLSVSEAGGSPDLTIIAFEWNDADLPASSGTYAVACNGSGIGRHVHVFYCEGAKQAAAADPKTNSSTTGTDLGDLTLTADVGSVVVVAALGLYDLTADSGQTQIAASATQNGARRASSYDSANLVVGYTQSLSGIWAIGAAAVEPAPSGGLTSTIAWLRI